MREKSCFEVLPTKAVHSLLQMVVYFQQIHKVDGLDWLHLLVILFVLFFAQEDLTLENTF